MESEYDQIYNNLSLEFDAETNIIIDDLRLQAKSDLQFNLEQEKCKLLMLREEELKSIQNQIKIEKMNALAEFKNTFIEENKQKFQLVKDNYKLELDEEITALKSELKSKEAEELSRIESERKTKIV